MLLQGLGDRPGQRRCGVARCAEGRAHCRGTASMGGGGGRAGVRGGWGSSSTSRVGPEVCRRAGRWGRGQPARTGHARKTAHGPRVVYMPTEYV